jgi:hypothetical protein
MTCRSLKTYTAEEIREHVANGGQLVSYYYCLTCLYTMQGMSDVYVVHGRWDRVKAGLGYTLMTFVLGWWSPLGFVLTPIYALLNLTGGVDVTESVLADLKVQAIASRIVASSFQGLDSEAIRSPQDPRAFLAQLAAADTKSDA